MHRLGHLHGGVQDTIGHAVVWKMLRVGQLHVRERVAQLFPQLRALQVLCS